MTLVRVVALASALMPSTYLLRARITKGGEVTRMLTGSTEKNEISSSSFNSASNPSTETSQTTQLPHMDPWSLSASVAGLASLTLEIGKLLGGYVSDVKSAPQDADKLHAEVTALAQALDRLVEFLRREDTTGPEFKDTSVLCSIIVMCQKQINVLYKKLGKQENEKTSKVAGIIEGMKWPFQKEEFESTVRSLNRFTQTFEFSLTIENWYIPSRSGSMGLLTRSSSLLSKTSSEVLSKLDENMNQIQGLMKMLPAIPMEMQRLSSQIAEVQGAVAEFANAGEDIRKIMLGVDRVEETLKGIRRRTSSMTLLIKLTTTDKAVNDNMAEFHLLPLHEPQTKSPSELLIAVASLVIVSSIWLIMPRSLSSFKKSNI